jgi:hypothetical protein
MLRFWTEVSDAKMPMPAASALMPIPSFFNHNCYYMAGRGQLSNSLLLSLFFAGFSEVLFGFGSSSPAEDGGPVQLSI